MNQILLYSAGALVLIVAAFLVFNRPQLITVDAPLPEDFPADGYSHDVLEGLLRKYVDEAGDVNYAAWHASIEDRRLLESYLAAASAFSPENAPHRFPGRNDRLAYWMYSYNAYVIWSILREWPLSSVTDVKPPLEVVTGLGFFYRQRFLFGETAYSLYGIENDRIRKGFKDPRIHFVLNCASDSCPVLRPELPVGDELESLLRQATLDFVQNPKYVSIDHDNKTIYLSTIFDWFEKDFVNELRRRGLSSERGSLDYVIDVAPPPLKNLLREAVSYDVVYSDYDWALNEQHSS